MKAKSKFRIMFLLKVILELAWFVIVCLLLTDGSIYKLIITMLVLWAGNLLIELMFKRIEKMLNLD